MFTLINLDKFKSWIRDNQYHLYQEIGNWGMFRSELYWSSVVCLSVCKRFTFSSTGPISTKLGTKHPRVKGILIYSNKGPCTSLRGHKNTLTLLKISSSRTTGPNLISLGTKYQGLRWFIFLQMKDQAFLKIGRYLVKYYLITENYLSSEWL